MAYKRLLEKEEDRRMMSTILSILEQTEGLGKAELNEMKKNLLIGLK